MFDKKVDITTQYGSTIVPKDHSKSLTNADYRPKRIKKPKKNTATRNRNHNPMTEEQAKYLTDMRLARILKNRF